MEGPDRHGETPTLQRRRSTSETHQTPESGEPAGRPEEWLSSEREAVEELKRGAIAAQFPEEFNVDSDILNGASNVWLPARLHPEIAPGEFQEWLKKHGSQLSKMEDSVNRRKSILSYSYDEAGGAASEESGDEARVGNTVAGMAFGMRRRNTIGLVRRKSFMERAEEEDAEAVLRGEDAAPFLVQSVQRSSLKRSKLANKRRDSTASSGGSRRRGRGRGSGRSGSTRDSSPAVSSPLAPAMADDVEQRLSTAEILKQVTAAVDDFGFDDFELGAFDTSGDEAAQHSAAPSAPPAQLDLAAQSAPETLHQPLHQTPNQPECKTVTHKKSGSWWQWGRDDAAPAPGPGAAESPEPRAAAAQPGVNAHGPSGGYAAASKLVRIGSELPLQQQQQATATGDNGSSLKARLPSPISFLRFNRKSKKDRKAADGAAAGRAQQPASRASAAGPIPASGALQQTAATPAGKPALASLAVGGTRVDDGDSDASSDSDVTPAGRPQPLSASRPGAPANTAQHAIPSIITPVRPPPTRLAGGNNNRLPIHIERAIYRLASIKLANPRRPLLQQVLLSNMMFWYLELINPKQSSPPKSPSPPLQQPEPQPGPRAGSPQPGPRAGSPQPNPQQGSQHASRQQGPQHTPRQQGPQQNPQHPPHNNTQQQQHQHPPDRRGKRGAAQHKPREGARRRSNNGSEQVLMRSPQYERQQQQIYMAGTGPGYAGQRQSPPSSPQPVYYQQQQQQQPQHLPYSSRSASRSQPSVSRPSQSDEDDDVPLALYRGEHNAMSIG
ncbi:hypothetical protein H4R24_004833 [Coemansia sp. RSA 988]|nr:hypothetical protein H4R24_004833 [Coemansia sp. RSA 988]